MFWVIAFLLGTAGSGTTKENTTKTPGMLRKSLHGPPAGVAPSALEDALTVAASTGGSHFQKLPGNMRKSFNRTIFPYYLFLSIAAGAYKLAG